MNWYYERFGERHGPVSIQELTETLDRGEITVDNLVWREGMPDWKPLKEADVLKTAGGEEMAICAHSGVVMEKSKMMPYGDKFIAPEHREAFVQGLMESGDSIGVDEDGIVPSDFNVDIGRCLSRAWDTLSMSFWPIVGVTALIMVMIGAASQIPFANLIIVYPSLAGLFYYLLRKVRNQPVEIGDAFYGFSNGFTKFMLMNLVVFGISMAIVIPAVVLFIGLAATEEPALAIVGVSLGSLLYCVIIYLGFAWTLAPLICLDKDVGFWDSMKISMKTFNKQFFWFALFSLVIIVINILGVALLCLGWFVTAPLTMLATVHLYEDIFGGRRNATEQRLLG